MDVEYTIALGSRDDAIELPWAAGELRYYDLKHQPELLLNVQEAFENEELGQFLVAMNSANSMFETVKCDAWLSDKIEEEEQVYGGGWKFASYVDIVFSAHERRRSLAEHEQLAAALAKLLKRAPQISVAAEMVVRHCYFHTSTSDSEQGFGISLYLTGFGADDPEARKRWTIGMKLIENALLQLSAERRREAASARQA